MTDRRCDSCYGDVRGECIRAGFCVSNPPPLFPRLRCAFGFHAPSEGRGMGTSIERKRTKPWAMFRYDYDCPRCGRTYTRWQ